MLAANSGDSASLHAHHRPPDWMDLTLCSGQYGTLRRGSQFRSLSYSFFHSGQMLFADDVEVPCRMIRIEEFNRNIYLLWFVPQTHRNRVTWSRPLPSLAPDDMALTTDRLASWDFVENHDLTSDHMSINKHTTWLAASDVARCPRGSQGTASCRVPKPNTGE